MITINTLWTRLDPTAQQWLLSNPGCIVLPRTLVNRVEKTTGMPISTDRHGEYWLSSEELGFLKARRRADTAVERPTVHPAKRSIVDAGEAAHVEALDR